MNQYPDVQKVLTENPLIDEIIYECQQILKGIIVKDDEQLLKNETVVSLKEADLYHDIQCGTDIFINYEYTYDIFMKIPSMDEKRAKMYADGYLAIPEGMKPELQRLAREKWLANYNEKNEYCRLLWGKPPLGAEYIYLNEEEYNMIPVETYDISKPVHMCTNSEAKLLYSSGVIDHMKERHPEAKYLDHLGERSVHPYIARRLPKFSLLYMPAIDSPEVSNKWRERYEINRVYAIKTIYSEAYHYRSDYYDRFIILMIIIMTFDDMLVYSPEYIIDRELFDFRTIQYMMEASGVEFYPEIPLKYQKRLIKNLNRLIKYKSSAKCMVDIVSLFGYDNMKLFKYYLLKSPILDEDGTYRKDTYTDPKTGKEVLNLEANYNLQFLKVPITGIADDYIDDPSNMKDYDETAANDIYWNGVYTKEYVKHEILKHEFDCHISKYISVDTVYSLTEMQFQMVYFINMLLYSKVNTDLLQVEVPEISSSGSFKLVDLIIELYALGYMYLGTKDIIMYDPIQYLGVYGFNFATDLQKLEDYIESEGFTMEELGIDKFINPNPIGIRDWDELDNVYSSNKKVYENLVHLINNANDYDEYKVYRKVYESLYVTRLNFKMFTDKAINNVPPKTYTDYIQAADTTLYTILLDCDAIPKDNERRVEIGRVINCIVDAIYTYIDQDKFKFIFNGIPTVGLDYIRKYIFLIINFFKSYKVDVIHTNIMYIFDDKLNNKVNVIDKIILNYMLERDDKIHVSDCFKLLLHFSPEDRIDILEKIYFEITRWKSIHFVDYIWIRDKWTYLLKVVFSDNITVREVIKDWIWTFEWSEHISLLESLRVLVKVAYKETIRVEDHAHFNIVREGEPPQHHIN